ncbi:MAG: hypothetical protein KDA86_17180 [Planctomycetaceae bacterium]|nr:hypothetical protein [Planctomycetaceae bacterium]
MVDLKDRQPSVLLISADLFLGSRIRGAVSASGASLSVVSSGQTALSRLMEDQYALILVDLETPGIDLVEIVRTADSVIPTSTVAYGPHVKERLLTAAKDAGCTEVLSRGKFDATIGEILSRHLTGNE